MIICIRIHDTLYNRLPSTGLSRQKANKLSYLNRVCISSMYGSAIVYKDMSILYYYCNEPPRYPAKVLFLTRFSFSQIHPALTFGVPPLSTLI